MIPHITEIILIFLIMAIIFGLGKLPDIGRALGELRANSLDGHDPGGQTPDPIDLTPDGQPVNINNKD